MYPIDYRIQWTNNFRHVCFTNMSVYLRGSTACVLQPLLDISQICAIFQLAPQFYLILISSIAFWYSTLIFMLAIILFPLLETNSITLFEIEANSFIHEVLGSLTYTNYSQPTIRSFDAYCQGEPVKPCTHQSLCRS